MRASTLLAVTALSWCLTANAAPSQRLTEARKLIDDLELEAALKTLDAAEKTDANDRATLQEIYLLQGIAFGTLGKEAKTRDSFRKLLLIAPEATLPADLPPRVRTPFFEAKDWASTNGPLLAVPSADFGDALVRAVKVVIEKDVLRLARTARFHLKVDGAEQTTDVPFTAGKAVAPVGKPSVSWWAELLNERGGVVKELASAKAPREEGVASVAVTAGVEKEAPSAGGWRRPTGIAVLGAGAVAAGVGVVLGLQANEARSKVANATRDELGRVTSLTQVEAQALEASGRSQATVANVLFGVGGALGAAGLVLIILGPEQAPTVALTPVAGGVVIGGTFQ